MDAPIQSQRSCQLSFNIFLVTQLLRHANNNMVYNRPDWASQFPGLS